MAEKTEEKTEDLKLTLREADMLHGVRVCSARIERRIKADPLSVRVKPWEARLVAYETAEQQIALTAKIRALGGDVRSRRAPLVTH